MNDFDTVNMNKLQKAIYYFREYGWEYTKNRALKKLGIPVPEETEYMNWLRKKTPSSVELKEQKEGKGLKSRPEVAVLIDTGISGKAGSSLAAAERKAGSGILEKSLQKQSYPVSFVKKLSDCRTKNSAESLLQEALGDTNAGIFVFAEGDVRLVPSFLYECVKAFEDCEEAELVYTDEDCGTEDGKHRMRPYFKPDIAPELLCNFQYIGGAFAVKRGLLERLVKSGKELALTGNGWYELIFELVELLIKEEEEAAHTGKTIDTSDFSRVHPLSVCHVSKVLFTRIVGEKFDGFYRRLDENDKIWIERHLKRTGIKGEVVDAPVEGFYHVHYELPEKKPLVSVLIATRDHTEDLEVCIRSLQEKNRYQNFEIVLAENNSEDPETFRYYEKLTGVPYDSEKLCEGTLPGGQAVRVVTWKGEFNYSGINNLAAAHAKGEIFLLLNNDTEIMAEDSMEEMVASCLLNGAGGSGAMLYYKDDTIQHGGVVYKIGGFAANALWSLDDRDEKYYPYSVTAREMSACTAACLMLRREAFEAAGGFDEKLCVALNDVDLCMKVRQAGYKIIFNPYAKLHHYESKSRGLETTPEKQERFNREIEYFQSKWQDKLDLGDPYYNVNQTLHYANYSLELAEDNRGRYTVLKGENNSHK